MEPISDGRELSGSHDSFTPDPTDASASSASQTPSPSHPIDKRISQIASTTLHSHCGVNIPDLLLHQLLTDIPLLNSRCISLKQPDHPSLTLILTRSSDSLINLTFKHQAKPGKAKPDKLGEGGIKSIYLATSLDISTEGLLERPQTKALGVTPSLKFSSYPLALLRTIPPSPYLLGRPESCAEYRRRDPSKFSKIYISMPLLDTPDLHDMTENPTLTQSQKWVNFVQSISNAAKGACALGPTFIHRDLSSCNISSKGIFDYDTLCEEGYHTFAGPPIKMQPPQTLLGLLHEASLLEDSRPYANIASQLKKLIPSLGLAYTLHEIMANEVVQRLIKACHAPKGLFYYDEEKSKVLIHYTQKYDVFILGYQFLHHYGSLSMLPTDETTRSFIDQMTELFEHRRPTMEEVASFFETLYLSIAPPQTPEKT